MDCRFVLPLLQTNVAHGACTTPGGESGHCRHLRFCVLDVFTASYSHFLPYFCRISRSVRHHYCERCSIGKVLCVIKGKWEVVTTSDVAHVLHCSITACLSTWSAGHTHMSQSGQSKNSVAVELGTIVLAATHEQPFPLDHYHRRPPKCGFGGPNFILQLFFLAAKWSLRVSSPDMQRCWTETGARVRTV